MFLVYLVLSRKIDLSQGIICDVFEIFLSGIRNIYTVYKFLTDSLHRVGTVFE